MAPPGRKPRQTIIEQPAVNEEQVRTDLVSVDALPTMLAEIQENAQALAVQLSYDGALTVESLEEEIKFYQRRSVEAVLEVGKRLLLLKEVAGHGTFIERIEAIGIGYKMANKFMASTLKFSKVSSTRLFELPNINQGKLLELLVLDDEEIETLSSGDVVRGIILDDVDCMSVSELRRALRQEKAAKEADVAAAKSAVSAQLAAKDKIIADKSKLVSDLVAEKNKRECLTVDEQAADLERALSDDTLFAVGALLPIRQGVYKARAMAIDCPQGLYVAMQNSLDRIIAEAMSIATDFGIQLNFNSAEDDEFLGDPNAGETFDNTELNA